MKAIILAASQSKRLYPFTDTRPKPLIEVAGHYILDPMLRFLEAAGIHDVLIVVNHQQDLMRESIGNGDPDGLKIRYVYQESLDGIGSAVRACKPYVGQEDFVLIYGDVLLSRNVFHEALKTHYDTGQDLAVVTLPKSSRDFGNVYLDHTMRIRKLVEKPQDDQHANYVLAGIFIFSTEFFALLDQFQNNIELCFQEIIQTKGLQATLSEKGWMDMIYPWHVLEANRMIMDQWKEARIHHSVQMKGIVTIEGPVVIEENVVLQSGSILHGPCFIGKDTYVGNNSLIRPYSSLGSNCTVGYGTEVKNSVIFGGVTLGSLSSIGDSVIGEGVKLGSGIITVNHRNGFETIVCQLRTGAVETHLTKLGAFIGDRTVVGAGHTLGPGTIIGSHQIIPDLISFS